MSAHVPASRTSRGAALAELRASTAPLPARRVWRLRLLLLALWAAVSFGGAWFARDLDFTFGGAWPLHEWMAAQGAILVFIGIMVVYAWVMRRVDDEHTEAQADAPPPEPVRPAADA